MESNSNKKKYFPIDTLISFGHFEGVDTIDLVKDKNSLNIAKGLGFITNNRQKHCFILSEQGYMILTEKLFFKHALVAS